MLTQRIITAVILAIVCISLIVLTSLTIFHVLTVMLCTLAAWEWSKMITNNNGVIVGYALSIAALCIALRHQPMWVLSISMLWWLLALSLVIALQKGVVKELSKSQMLIMGVCALVPLSVALSTLRYHPEGREWIIYFLLLVASADSGGYFGGKKFGKTKLASNVSPGKTIEGLICGLLLALVVTISGAMVLEVPKESYPLFIGISIITALVSVLGDLLESTVKRMCHVKDSGHILPGHGGVLDRIDGILAAAPVFTLLMGGLYV